MAEEDLALDLTGKKKKGKKTKVVLEEGESAEKLPEVTEIREEEIASLELTKLNLVDANSDWPDYSYDELLDMVYDIMREKNPDLAAGKKKTFLMKPPQVARAGSKKTGFFLLNWWLYRRKSMPYREGKIPAEALENVLRKYIKEYVTCHTCRSSETELTKDTRLFFLQCKTCGSRCSVTAIKSGFTAMVGKRAVMRRAAEATAGK
uniref:Eukaryotic translation initiation factor 2 subunit 2 n=1 Tax=Ditylenchus dipsaci TaxID=166011 RepID=A0A915ER71_9BILA